MQGYLNRLMKTKVRKNWKMRFIPVIGRMTDGKDRYDRLVIKMAGSCLFSLINAFKNKRFGLDTVFDTKQYVRKLRKEILNPFGAEIFIDSGGYSFIKGDIDPNELTMMIECYTDYLKTETREFDHIFSLDLPVSLEYERFNTREKVLKYNRKSLEMSLELLEDQPKLVNQFYFVWQFKLLEQYEIWKRLSAELRINDVIHNRAIGGMVGLRKMAGIEYSPFIAMTYRCFRDYLDARDSGHDFKLHFLGVNHPADRFVILILERLLKYYLQSMSRTQDVVLTYDTISCRHGSMFKGRNLKVHEFAGDNLVTQSLDKIPDRLITGVYGTGKENNMIRSELDNLNNGRKRKNTACLYPFSVYSHMEENRFFEWIIDTHKMLDMLIGSPGIQKYKRRLKSKLADLAKAHPKVFTRTLCRNLKESLPKVFKMHFWHHNHPIGDDQGFDDIITTFTKMINAPGSLK